MTNPISTDYSPTHGRVYGIKFCNSKTEDLVLHMIVP